MSIFEREMCCHQMDRITKLEVRKYKKTQNPVCSCLNSLKTFCQDSLHGSEWRAVPAHPPASEATIPGFEGRN